MASKVVGSISNFASKLLHHQPSCYAAAPSLFAHRTFSSRTPSQKPNHHDPHDPHPFLREGEIGPCRVEKTKHGCYMRVDVPGIVEEDMKIWAEPGYIYFRAEDSKLPQFNYDGRVYGGAISFNPDSYDSAGIKAEVKEGVLWMTVPRVKSHDE